MVHLHQKLKGGECIMLLSNNENIWAWIIGLIKGGK